MLKEIKYFIFIFVITLFVYFTLKFYFSDTNKRNSFRALNNIDKKLLIDKENLPILENDTNNVIEYNFEGSKKNKIKKRYFWNLLDDTK